MKSKKDCFKYGIYWHCVLRFENCFKLPNRKESTVNIAATTKKKQLHHKQNHNVDDTITMIRQNDRGL